MIGSTVLEAPDHHHWHAFSFSLKCMEPMLTASLGDRLKVVRQLALRNMQLAAAAYADL